MVDSWTESMTARERVETIATTLSEPRTTNWIADQAEVKWDTAKRHLDDLALDQAYEISLELGVAGN